LSSGAFLLSVRRAEEEEGSEVNGAKSVTYLIDCTEELLLFFPANYWNACMMFGIIQDVTMRHQPAAWKIEVASLVVPQYQ
jgi:hypothetical protein